MHPGAAPKRLASCALLALPAPLACGRPCLLPSRPSTLPPLVPCRHPQWYHHSNPRALSRTGVDGRPRLPVPVMLAFGGLAGLVAQTATYPLDVVRRQMQVRPFFVRLQGWDCKLRARPPARQVHPAYRIVYLRLL